ncbi:hypothetical protein HANVADRAFT_52307 [Hanseniaspora valbyensis NRRL Y-1626]|uniref:Pre-rRNA-processing protein Ipi1 N-terminal domain-containing protein n=1 Tax=Hanseniaspora valbyensis NRRL Y-1626 TaxID=766949 RepID=A0A1B7TFW5_9ASCO|nr:hypothetical protein HANVADRAFT_52307 [Hanseniaspora valbyensis NRRL Y-1626]
MAKKKTEKQKDFVKKKLKVGKKFTASNETSINFNSKKIKLANQRKITTSNAVTALSNDQKKLLNKNSENKISSQELLTRVSLLKHHSNISRKETLLTFIKNFDTFNQLQLINLIKNSLHLFIDPDFQVREEYANLLTLINDKYPDIIISNLNSIMLYLINGITHIIRDIKLHTGKFLLIILANKLLTIEKILIVNNSFFLKLLNGILDIIGIDKTVKSNKNLIDKQNLKLNNSTMSGNVTLSKKTINYKLTNLKALQLFLTKILKRDFDINAVGFVDSYLPNKSYQPFTRLQLFNTNLLINSIKEWTNNGKKNDKNTDSTDYEDIVSFQDYNARINVVKNEYYDILIMNLEMIKNDWGYIDADRKGNSELGRIANNCINILNECI